MCWPQDHIKLVQEAFSEPQASHDQRRMSMIATTLLNVNAFTIAPVMNRSPNTSTRRLLYGHRAQSKTLPPE